MDDASPFALLILGVSVLLILGGLVMARAGMSASYLLTVSCVGAAATIGGLWLSGRTFSGQHRDALLFMGGLCAVLSIAGLLFSLRGKPRRHILRRRS